MLVITQRTQTLQTILESRHKQLRQLIRETQQALKTAPDGHLRAHHSCKRRQYFWRKSPQDRTGEYISKTNTELISSLAQKEYDTKFLKYAMQEDRLIDALLRELSSQHLEDLYTELNDLRKPYVSPRAISDELYIQKWQEEAYDRKSFAETTDAPEFITDRGERVRSKSELILANRMNSFGIPYQYEHPLYLKGLGTVYPDFRILLVKSHRVVYLEHNGMMSDPMYLNHFMKKQAAYIKNGLIPGRDVIFTFESADYPLDSKTVTRLCEELTSM